MSKLKLNSKSHLLAQQKLEKEIEYKIDFVSQMTKYKDYASYLANKPNKIKIQKDEDLRIKKRYVNLRQFTYLLNLLNIFQEMPLMESSKIQNKLKI